MGYLDQRLPVPRLRAVPRHQLYSLHHVQRHLPAAVVQELGLSNLHPPNINICRKKYRSMNQCWDLRQKLNLGGQSSNT